MHPVRLDPNVIRQQIANLILQYPELQEDEALRSDMIEGETEAFEFLREVERRRQEAATMAGAIASNIAELEIRQGRFERREQAMRELMFKVMQAAEIKKAELPEATISVRNGSQRVIITDEAIIPDILCRIKREPDKTKIKELLASGNPVQGAELSNAEPSLSVRVK